MIAGTKGEIPSVKQARRVIAACCGCSRAQCGYDEGGYLPWQSDSVPATGRLTEYPT